LFEALYFADTHATVFCLPVVIGGVTESVLAAEVGDLYPCICLFKYFYNLLLRVLPCFISCLLFECDIMSHSNRKWHYFRGAGPEHSKVQKSPESTIRDESSFKHLSRFFGGLTLAELTPARLSEYKSLRRSEGAKTATLAKELELLRHALNLAIREWEWLARNPFEKVKIDKAHNKVERWITFEEEKRLLDASQVWLREIITFVLNTGMRRNEILSLQWSEVDFFRRTATLLKTKNKEKRTAPLNQTA